MNNWKKWFYRIGLVICIFVFCYSGFRLIQMFVEYKTASNEYDDLEEEFLILRDEEDAKDDEKSESSKDGEQMEEFQVDFAALQKENEDCIGWIRFEPLSISYPIVKGKDNDYYLTHTFLNKENKSGSIFMDFQNAADFSDDNTFIYGHNMKDKSMFAKLNQYMEQDFFEENPYFWVYTLEKTYKYQIFSSQTVHVEDEAFTYSFANQETYGAYMEKMKNNSAYDTGVEIDPTKKMVTLMTCRPSEEEYRMLVHGICIEEMDAK